MDKKDVVRRALEAALTGEKAAIRPWISPSYRLHERGVVTATGPVEAVHRMAELRNVIPDIRQDIDAVVEDGGTVVIRWTLRGRMTGDLPGIAGNGRPIEIHGMTWSTIDDGTVGETWMAWDRMQMIEQTSGSA